MKNNNYPNPDVSAITACAASANEFAGAVPVTNDDDKPSVYDYAEIYTSKQM